MCSHPYEQLGLPCSGVTGRQVDGGLLGLVAFGGLLDLVGFVARFCVVVILVLPRLVTAAVVDIRLRAAVVVDNDANAFLLSLEVMHFFCTCADTLRSTFCKSWSSVGTGPPGRAFINACATDTGSTTGGVKRVTFSNPWWSSIGPIIGDIHVSVVWGDGVSNDDGLLGAPVGIVAIGVSTALSATDVLLVVG